MNEEVGTSELDSEEEIQLIELRKEVQLSNMQLLELTYNDGTWAWL